jgi:hypothetical protein
MAPRFVRLVVALAAAAFVLEGGGALAEQWGGIEPGDSSMAVVKSLRGTPTRTTKQKVEGYDTEEWIYEDAKAPAGIKRMVVEFGLMTAAGYRGDLVRSFKLEPKPGAFNKEWITQGWGAPSGVGKDGDVEFFFYKEGLFVYFAPDGHGVVTMTFTPPQLPPPGAVLPKR